MVKTYSEKLKDPRWQKKRLEVLSRDNFTCQLCNDTKETLQVHHLKYIRGNEPWEYDLDNFKCLCESCHKTTKVKKVFACMSCGAENDVPNNPYNPIDCAFCGTENRLIKAWFG